MILDYLFMTSNIRYPDYFVNYKAFILGVAVLNEKTPIIMAKRTAITSPGV